MLSYESSPPAFPRAVFEASWLFVYLLDSRKLTSDQKYYIMLMALDARDGKVLYRFNTGGMGGGVVTYQEAGKQYVAAKPGKPSRSG